MRTIAVLIVVAVSSAQPVFAQEAEVVTAPQRTDPERYQPPPRVVREDPGDGYEHGRFFTEWGLGTFSSALTGIGGLAIGCWVHDSTSDGFSDSGCLPGAAVGGLLGVTIGAIASVTLVGDAMNGAGSVWGALVGGVSGTFVALLIASMGVEMGIVALSVPALGAALGYEAWADGRVYRGPVRTHAAFAPAAGGGATVSVLGAL